MSEIVLHSKAMGKKSLQVKMAQAPGARCWECPLKAQTFVPGEGLDQADIVIVGEAPGRVEEVKGRPFVGPAGDILHRTLDALKAKGLYITNAALCRPPQNKMTPAALRACRDRLILEIKAHNPRIVLTLGNSPLNVLLGGSGGITKRRGRMVHSDELGCLITATFHPAAVLRNPDYFPDFALDVERAIKPPHPEFGQPHGPQVVRVIENVQEAVEFLQNEVDPQPEVVLDLETSGFDRVEDVILCAVFSWEVGTATIIDGASLYAPEVVEVLRVLFTDPRKTWIGHGMKFDVEFLDAQLGTKPHIGFDTLLAHYALDERRGTHDLKVLAGVAFNAPDWESDLKSYLSKPKKDSYAMLPRDVLWRYASYDGDYTWRLYQLYKEELAKEPTLEKLHRTLLVPAQNALSDIENHGVLIDMELVEEAEDIYGNELYRLEQGIVEYVEDPNFNPNSTQQVARILFDKLHLPMIEGRSTNKDVLEALKGMHPFVDLMRRYRKAAKQFSTYVVGIKKLVASSGRVHTSFLIHGTVTGRLSSNQPNLQNITREAPIEGFPDIRDFFVASPGMVLVYADYNQAEMRALAWYSQDEFLLDVYQGDRNLHAEVAIQMFGQDYNHEQYMLAKMVNFGLVYGRTPWALAKDSKIQSMSTQEAQIYIQKFFERMPKAVAWANRTQMAARTQGVLESPFGRRRRFGLITDRNMYEIDRQAVNFMCSTLATDLTLTSLLRLHDIFKKSKKAYILLTVHDSLLAECKPEHLGEVAWLMRKTMEGVAYHTCGGSPPFRVDIETGHRWGSLEKYEPTYTHA